MTGNRDETTREILKAVGALLARAGFRALGVNAVAREAGVDKVLLYRYFGGLPKLLEAFAATTDYWPSDDELLGPPAETAPSLAEGAAAVMGRFARALRGRPATLEILLWELFERNELTDALSAARERQGLRLLERIPAAGAPVDAAAVSAVVAGGLTYLALRARTADAYNGVDLRSEEGWARIRDAAELLMRLALAEPEPRGGPGEGAQGG